MRHGYFLALCVWLSSVSVGQARSSEDELGQALRDGDIAAVQALLARGERAPRPLLELHAIHRSNEASYVAERKALEAVVGPLLTARDRYAARIAPPPELAPNALVVGAENNPLALPLASGLFHDVGGVLELRGIQHVLWPTESQCFDKAIACRFIAGGILAFKVDADVSSTARAALERAMDIEVRRRAWPLSGTATLPVTGLVVDLPRPVATFAVRRSTSRWDRLLLADRALDVTYLALPCERLAPDLLRIKESRWLALDGQLLHTTADGCYVLSEVGAQLGPAAAMEPLVVALSRAVERGRLAKATQAIQDDWVMAAARQP